MREKSFKERVEDLKKEYVGINDFDAHTVIRLEDEFVHVTNENPEHTRRRKEILDMRYRLLSGVRVKPAKNETYIKNRKIRGISIFSEQHFNTWYRIILNNDGVQLQANMSQILSDVLSKGVQKKLLIDVTGLRAIGKTHQLIEFAKKYDYTVIVPISADTLKKTYDYDKIYDQNSMQLRGIRKNTEFVVDEGVDVDKLKNELGLNIITGYTNK